MNATYEDWRAITAPRVQGAWNIHELIQDLDFFVALSSFVGAAGNVGQGIYSGTAVSLSQFSPWEAVEKLTLNLDIFRALCSLQKLTGIASSYDWVASSARRGLCC